MAEIILHHYPLSPFAEKARLALGLKGLAWGSVDTPPAPPRPLLTPLTGGYRRIPVMQIGADIYCDTNLILPTLERLHPEPPLYPRELAGIDKALSFNFERSIWQQIIGVMVHFMGNMPAEFIKDRKDDYLYFDMSKDAMEPHFEANVQQVRAQLTFLKTALADGRPFLAGGRPRALDLGYFHTISLVRKNAPVAEADALLGLSAIVPWYERVAAIGHGKPHEMTGEDALAAAKAATPADVGYVQHEGVGPKPGTNVTVTPDDFAKKPVTGTLLAAGAEEVVIHRHEDATGDLHVHFPRAGFEVKAA